MHLIDQHMLRENLLLAHRLRQFTQAVQHWTMRQTAPETGSNQQAVQHCFMSLASDGESSSVDTPKTKICEPLRLRTGFEGFVSFEPHIR